MITASTAYKAGLHGPKTYSLQISSQDSAWEAITWQDCPIGAEVIKPLGSIQQMTEDPQPFSFVGPDMQITARNVNGFWTNAGQTGRLDIGATVFMRVRVGVGAEYITLIQGPIDLSTIQRQAGDLVSFTVRGILNALDYKLAAEYCSTRQFAKSGVINGTFTSSYGRPVKFMDWLSIKPEGGASGLFSLKYDSNKKTIQLDGGVAVDLAKNDGLDFSLTGEGGTVIRCLYDSSNTQSFSGLPQNDVEEYILIKQIVQAPLNAYWAIYDSYPTAQLSSFKSGLAPLVDLDISSIPAMKIISPDSAISTIFPETEMYPAAVCGIGNGEFLISSYAGAYKGIWKIGISGDPMNVNTISKISPHVACYFKMGASSVIALCDTSANNNLFLTQSFITEWDVIVIDTQAWGVSESGFSSTATIAWKSFDALDASEGYCVNVFSGANGKIAKVDFTGPTLSNVGNAFDITGPGMIPGCVVSSPSESYYVCYPSIQNADGVFAVYSNAWSITGVSFASVETDINFTSQDNLGPVSCIPGIQSVNIQNQERMASGVMLLVDSIYRDKSSSATAFYYTKHLRTGGEVHVIDYSSNAAQCIYGRVLDQDLYHWGLPANTRTVFYTAFDLALKAGQTLEFTNGALLGESCIISAVEMHYQLTGGYTKITMTAPGFSAPPLAQSEFRCYSSGAVLTVAPSVNISELSGTVMLNNLVSYVRGNYYNTLSYMNYNTRFKLGNNNRGWIFNPLDASRTNLQGTNTTEVTWSLILSGEVYSRINEIPGIFPWCADTDGDGRILAMNRIGITLIHYDGATYQTPKVFNNLFDNKTVREAIEEVAVSCNAYLFPSEHGRKLTLQYRGTTPQNCGGITRDKYQYDGLWSPRSPYNLLELDGERMGSMVADKFGNDLSISSPQTHPSNRKSLAQDIWSFLSPSRRWHKLVTDWLIWHEPGDVVSVEVTTAKTIEGMVVSTETDPESLTHTLTILENE